MLSMLHRYASFQPTLGKCKEFQEHRITKKKIQYLGTDYRYRFSQQLLVIWIEIVNSDRPSVHISKSKNKTRIIGRDSTIHLFHAFVPEV